MNQSLKISQLSQITHDKKIVIVGGCFDILHIGHISFLTKAKEQGEILIVLLESDESIRKRKGENRPIHIQKERAAVLTALRMVDQVILLPEMSQNSDYDELIKTIHPSVIVTTEGDNGLVHKKRQSKLVQAQLLEVPFLKRKSTTQILELLSQEK